MRLWLQLKQLARDDRGSTVVVFALSLVALIGISGLTIDAGYAFLMRSKLQSALDTAVIAASRPVVPDDERQETFDRIFAANFDGGGIVPVTKFRFTKGEGGRGNAKLEAQNRLMPVLGFETTLVSVDSVASYDSVDLEIVLVLDISGSMNASMGGGSRIEVLKTAAKKLIDTVIANKPSGKTVKFAVVPFNMAVNIGVDNIAFVEGTTHPLLNGSTWGGCVLERRGGFHHRDVYNSASVNGSGKWHAYIWPPAPNSGGRCLNPSNGTPAGYASVEAAPLGLDPWLQGPNFNCPRFPLLSLTDNDSRVRETIDALEAYGNMGTTVGPAVGWGLRVLSPEAPFTEGAAFSKATRKIMVVLTDGEMVTDGGSSSCPYDTNSVVPYQFDPKTLKLDGKVLTTGPANDSFTPYGFIYDSNPFNATMNTHLDADIELDRLSIEACEEVKSKAAGQNFVEVFNIAVSTGAGPGTRAEKVLSRCATSQSHFFYANDEKELNSTFEKISENSLKLRLTQ